LSEPMRTPLISMVGVSGIHIPVSNGP
jgi:hypothetical protein